MKINILGWYGKGNVGDDSFQLVFQHFFNDLGEITFVTPPEPCPVADITILGGGAVVSPFYLKLLPKNQQCYAIGVDIAYESEIDLMSHFDFKGVYLRNRQDVSKVREKTKCQNVHSIPDLAFYLRPTGKKVLSKYKKDSSKKTIGVFVTDYINPAIDRPIDKFAERAWIFKTSLAEQLDTLSKEYEVVLVPCSTDGYGNDRRINLDLCAFMSHTPTNILDAIGPQDMIDLIAELDLAICMRFHAHIFSMIAGTPFLSLEFTRKVEILLKEHKLTECSLPMENHKITNLKTAVDNGITKGADTNALSRSYFDILNEIKGQLRQDFLAVSL